MFEDPGIFLAVEISGKQKAPGVTHSGKRFHWQNQDGD